MFSAYYDPRFLFLSFSLSLSLSRILKLILLNLLVFFIFSEIILQSLYYFMPDCNFKIMLHESVARKYSNTRNAIRFNEFSSNRIDLPPTQKADIVIIGDSFPFGFMVKKTNTFPSFMQSLTGKKVINIAVPGTYPLQYNRMVEVGMQRYDPDLIIYCIYANDFFDYLVDRFKQISKPSSQRYFDDLLFTEHFGFTYKMARLRTRILNASKTLLLFRRLADYVCLLGGGLLKDIVPVQIAGYTSYCCPGYWQYVLNLRNPNIYRSFLNTIYYIEKANSFVRARNKQFLVVLIPCKEMVYGPITKAFDSAPLIVPYNELCKHLELLEIHTLNLTAPLQNAQLKNKQEALFLYTDLHLTASGHKAVAEIVVQFLKDKKLFLSP